jgi:hypothetical protein
LRSRDRLCAARLRRISDVIIAVALAAACTGCPVSPPLSHLPDGQAAIDRLRASTACAQSMRIEDASASVPKVPIVKLGAMAIAERPDHFRFDFSAFGQLAATLTCDGSTLTFVNLRNPQTQQLPATADALASSVGIGVTPNVIVSLMLGRPPVLVHSQTPSVKWESGHYVVEIDSTNAWHEHIELIPRESDWNKPWQEQRMRLLRVRVSKEGLDLYDAHLGDHTVIQAAVRQQQQNTQLCNPELDKVLGTTCDAGATAPVKCEDVELPKDIEIESGGKTVSIYEKKVVLNPPIDPTVFRP